VKHKFQMGDKVLCIKGLNAKFHDGPHSGKIYVVVKGNYFDGVLGEVVDVNCVGGELRWANRFIKFTDKQLELFNLLYEV
jgi:hypothetical protein